jgi:hypothetical protein
LAVGLQLLRDGAVGASNDFSFRFTPPCSPDAYVED